MLETLKDFRLVIRMSLVYISKVPFPKNTLLSQDKQRNPFAYKGIKVSIL